MDACGADVNLIALAKLCLAPEPGERPADAGEVASEVVAYLDGLQAKVRRQEVETATLRSRLTAFRWRATAGVIGVLAVLVATVAGSWYKIEENARQAKERDRQQKEAILAAARSKDAQEHSI